MNKNYFEKIITKYLNSKIYLCQAKFFDLREEYVVLNFLHDNKEIDEANKYIAISKKYNTDQIIQLKKKGRKYFFNIYDNKKVCVYIYIYTVNDKTLEYEFFLIEMVKKFC